MPAKSIRIGLPVISDGHQFRTSAALRLEACTGDVHRLLLVEDAAVTIEHTGRRRLDPPLLLLLPPGWMGAVGIARGAFCYRIDLDGGPDLRDMLGGGVILRQGAEADPWRSDIIALAQRWWRSLPDRRRVAIHLTDLLLRLGADAGEPESDSPGLDLRFQRLVRAHLGSEERASDFARRLGVSRITLDRAMRRSTGTSAATWIRSQRLRAAADMLLRADRPYADIGGSCGFADPDSFVRAFKRLHGCTPRAWRARMLAGA